AEYLGPYYDIIAGHFAPPFRQVWTWEVDCPANWKVPVENSLESYHIDCLHPKTFGTMPPESDCVHNLTERSTSFRMPIPPSFTRWVQDFAVRRLGRTPKDFYNHHHVFPNLTVNAMDVYCLAQVFVPTSATTSRQLAWLYTLHGPKNGPVKWLYKRSLAWVVPWIVRKIFLEDLSIFAEVQRGLEASVHRGVIGTREERLYPFQQFVARECGLAEAQEQEIEDQQTAAAAGMTPSSDNS